MPTSERRTRIHAVDSASPRIEDRARRRAARGGSGRGRRLVAAVVSTVAVIVLGAGVGGYLARPSAPAAEPAITLHFAPDDLGDIAPAGGEPVAARDGGAPAIAAAAAPAIAAKPDPIPEMDGPEPPFGPLSGLGGAVRGALAQVPPWRGEAGESRHAALPRPRENLPVLPLRRNNAAPAAAARPLIAVVLDDLGVNQAAARRAITLPPPLSLAFMTYANGLGQFTADARAAGHELLLHVPMEPRDEEYDPGLNVLSEALPPGELARRLQWSLGRFPGFVGINNHMGSKFMASADGLAYVMGELKARGLFFLDSLTSPRSVGRSAARLAGVPFVQRDVFLDNDWQDPESIRRQLARLERVAERQGYAIGIGHPHPATLEVLAEWLPEAHRRGLALVPVSAIVRHRIDQARNHGDRAG